VSTSVIDENPERFERAKQKRPAGLFGIFFLHCSLDFIRPQAASADANALGSTINYRFDCANIRFPTTVRFNI